MYVLLSFDEVGLRTIEGEPAEPWVAAHMEFFENYIATRAGRTLR
jgi:hypothetical protein